MENVKKSDMNKEIISKIENIHKKYKQNSVADTDDIINEISKLINHLHTDQLLRISSIYSAYMDHNARKWIDDLTNDYFDPSTNTYITYAAKDVLRSLVIDGIVNYITKNPA